MRVSECRSYHSRTINRTLLRMPDGKSIFKMYFIDIVGRPERARYEWGQGSFPMTEFENLFCRCSFEGIGFVTAFPHITKVFRFAPSMETVLHVSAYNTRDLSQLNLGREEGYMEFACYAEAVIAADEYRAWAQSANVMEYLQFLCVFDDGPIADQSKLRGYWNG